MSLWCLTLHLLNLFLKLSSIFIQNIFVITGISRLTLPSGTKGFGGTEGFMAPEIMRYNGEEEYTEKVDCFSFGMFIYELLTLHQPFEGHESVKECILEGGRPPLTYRVFFISTNLFRNHRVL